MYLNFTFTKTRIALVGFCLFGSLFVGHAQEGEDGLKHCGTHLVLGKLLQENPKLKASFEARMALLKQKDEQDFKRGYPQVQNKNAPPTYIVPVVFHILHNYGAENISDAQVLDEMRILNRDYRGLNPDTIAVDSVFKSLIADTQIEFRLAKLDPNGHCTTGIDRIATLQTYVGSDNSKLNDWPSNKYLNVWVVSSISSGAAGYAYLPGTCPPNVDGIMILSSYIGSIGTSTTTTSRALTHEIGHYLDLSHCWGPTNQPGVSCGDDGISDTPVTKGWNHCPSIAASKVCNPGVEENYQNYMDYSYCSHMFTLGQANQMVSALNSNNASRNNLWTPANLAATGITTTPVVCAPNADFTPNTTVLVCAGSSTQFQYFLSNGQPTSWSWTFPGGTPAVSTDSFPTIQYQTPGTYSVTMTVSNSSGSNTATKTAYVIVTPPGAQYTANNYTEGFENSTTVSNDWIMVSPQGNPWSRVTTASSSGTACLRQSNQSNALGEKVAAISPSFDFTAIPSATMTFKLAFAQRATTNTDKLRLSFSADCGNSWSLRYIRSGSTLATTGVVSGGFVPTATQWRKETVGVSPYQGLHNVRMKFEIENGGGNTVYIDDINIASSFSGILEEAAGISNLMLYPNPVQDHVTVEFSLPQSQKVGVAVFDVSGRKAIALTEEQLSAGEHKLDIPVAGVLSPGMYFVTVYVNNKSLSQKLIVY